MTCNDFFQILSNWQETRSEPNLDHWFQIHSVPLTPLPLSHTGNATSYVAVLPESKSILFTVCVLSLLILQFYLFLFCAYVRLYVCLCAMCMRYPDSRKMALNPLELESQLVLSHHEGTGNGSWVLWKSSNRSSSNSLFWSSFEFLEKFQRTLVYLSFSFLSFILHLKLATLPALLPLSLVPTYTCISDTLDSKLQA